MKDCLQILIKFQSFFWLYGNDLNLQILKSYLTIDFSKSIKSNSFKTFYQSVPSNYDPHPSILLSSTFVSFKSVILLIVTYN